MRFLRTFAMPAMLAAALALPLAACGGGGGGGAPPAGGEARQDVGHC